MADSERESIELNINLTLRPKRDEDEPFLRELLAEVGAERLLFDTVDFDPEEKTMLLDLQFAAHQQHYQQVDWEKSECIVEREGTAIGYFIILRDGEEIRLADIVIAALHRGMGVGFAVIQGLQTEAEKSKLPLRLHVDAFSTARGFYEKMGFRLLEDRGTHHFLEWIPSSMQGKRIYLPGQG